MRFKLKLYNAKFGVVKITGHWGKKTKQAKMGTAATQQLVTDNAKEYVDTQKE